ncbi:MAG: hypothetical protein RMJ29_06880 [Candidatus Bipolaricaulota bacterium]|nr:hypothetical protein [Candidatus Bipolaricaulota bacterium]
MADVVDYIDVQAIIKENARIIRENRARARRFPQIYQIYNATELISTFSHLTPNLPFDEVFGNYVLPKIADAAGIPRDRVINCAYDNYIPRTDTPKAHTLQFGIVNPKVLHPEIIPSLQDGFFYDPRELIKDGQNRVKSAPEENLEVFRARFDQIEAILIRHSGPGDVSERLLRIRREFLALVGIETIPEVAFSKVLQPKIADVLEALFQEGFPFWEMPVPEEKYIRDTFLVEGIDAQKRRRPVRFVNGVFVFAYTSHQEKRIPAEKIFEALRNFEVIPTMPVVILATTTAPQIPHLGGAVWRHYAPKHVDAQASWLGIPERSDTLILSTSGHILLRAFRRNEEFIGFPVIYLTYGPGRIREALENGSFRRVEFKRHVLL